MEPDLIGLRDDQDNIHLRHLEPDGCLEAWRKRLVLWLARGVVVMFCFGVGFVIGRCGA